MEGQNEICPSASVDDGSCIQHQGVAAAITLQPGGARRQNGIILNAWDSINDGGLSVADTVLAQSVGLGQVTTRVYKLNHE